MSIEKKLSKQLQQFSVIDLACVKTVYFVCSLLFFSLYPAVSVLDWWFYLVISLLCAIPLEIHVFSQKGSLLEKIHIYLKTNNPSNQMLLFLSVFFFTLMLGTLFPILTRAYWWVYLIIMVLVAIKPTRKSWFW
jgi:hypothetical protein